MFGFAALLRTHTHSKEILWFRVSVLLSIDNIVAGHAGTQIASRASYEGV